MQTFAKPFKKILKAIHPPTPRARRDVCAAMTEVDDSKENEQPLQGRPPSVEAWHTGLGGLGGGGRVPPPTHPPPMGCALDSSGHATTSTSRSQRYHVRAHARSRSRRGGLEREKAVMIVQPFLTPLGESAGLVRDALRASAFSNARACIYILRTVRGSSDPMNGIRTTL